MKHNIAKMIAMHGGSMDQGELVEQIPHPREDVLKALDEMIENNEISYDSEGRLQLGGESTSD